MATSAPVAMSHAAPVRSSAEKAGTREAVRRVISQIAALPPNQQSAAKQQALFDQLVAIGPRAVPAITELMDDRSRLPVPELSLENKSPNAFEAYRHYGPALMVDALAAVLNQITGRSFGSLYNSTYDKVSEADRRSVVKAWRDYARSQPQG